MNPLFDMKSGQETSPIYRDAVMLNSPHENSTFPVHLTKETNLLSWAELS